MNKRIMLASLLFPLAVFIALVFYKQIKVSSGVEIILPITGFDPRDILSGHYLIYRIDYGLEGSSMCGGAEKNNTEVYLCLKQSKVVGEGYVSEMYRYYETSDLYGKDCDAVIRGRCRDGRFAAGIEKFYIPEEYAYSLDRVVGKSRGKIVLSVTRGGSASIKDLLIDGKSWREYKED